MAFARELVEGREGLSAVVLPLHGAHAALQEQYTVLRKRMRSLSAPPPDERARHWAHDRADGPGHGGCPNPLPEVTPGSGPFGLTPKRYPSGETDQSEHASKCGDAMMRAALFGGAQALPVCTGTWSAFKAWGLGVARRRGRKRAIVAVARKLSVILHRMWPEGAEFRWGKEAAAAALPGKARRGRVPPGPAERRFPGDGG